MKPGGYAGRIGWVDLSTRGIDYRSLPERDARLYLGGRGLGVKTLLPGIRNWNSRIDIFCRGGQCLVNASLE